MTENDGIAAGNTTEDLFEIQLRGYHRRQVEDYVAQANAGAAELETRLAGMQDEAQRLRAELAAVRQAAASQPSPEEPSERIAQILRLAGDEASAQKKRSDEETTALRARAKQEADDHLAAARAAAKQLATSARDRADGILASAVAEAEQIITSSQDDAKRATADAQQRAQETVEAAAAEATQLLADATGRATAMNTEAGQRLDQIKAAHAETVRRLNTIGDTTASLVASDTASGPLHDEDTPDAKEPVHA